MKKIYTVIPVALIVFCLAFFAVFTVFTTPALYEDKIFRNGVDRGEMLKKYAPLAETAYKYDDKMQNAEMLWRMYSPYYYLICEYKGEKLPDNFKQKSLEYCKMMCDMSEDEYFKEDFARAVSVELQNDANHRTMVKRFSTDIPYAYALLINGKTEDSKQIIEQYIKDYGKDPKSYLMTLDQFFYFAYYTVDDEAYRAWIIEKELEVTNALRQTGRLSEENAEKENCFENPASLAALISWYS